MVASPSVVRVLCVVLCGAVVASAARPRKSSDVVQLSSSNFDTLVSEGQWLIKFYAPWCGHCKTIAPKFEAAAKAMKGKVNFAEVDGTADRALMTRFPVKGFPTLFHLEGTTVKKFNGGRTKESIIKFVEEGYQTAPEVSYWSSPFSPLMRGKAGLMGLATSALSWHTVISDITGLPEIASMFVVFLTGMMTLTFGVLVIAYCTQPPPKKKRQ